MTVFEEFLTCKEEYFSNFVYARRDHFEADLAFLEQVKGRGFVDEIRKTHHELDARKLADSECVKVYKLEVSSWTLRSTLAKLIKQLQEHGAIVIGGSFGETFYNQEAREISDQKQIEGRKVFEFPAHSRNFRTREVDHAIVIIGAEPTMSLEHESDGFVYYIDPNTDERVYKITYYELIEQSNPSREALHGNANRLS